MTMGRLLAGAVAKGDNVMGLRCTVFLGFVVSDGWLTMYAVYMTTGHNVHVIITCNNTSLCASSINAYLRHGGIMKINHNGFKKPTATATTTTMGRQLQRQMAID